MVSFTFLGLEEASVSCLIPRHTSKVAWEVIVADYTDLVFRDMILVVLEVD